MKLWRKAAGALKDKNSICIAHLSWNSSSSSDLEKAIIKATSHDEKALDYQSTQRVFSWIRATPLCLKPLFLGLSRRMVKTRSWVVALKGLILLHGILSCKVPAVQTIGRLPFDLGKFKDCRSKFWGFNVFVRNYYAFLDKKSAFMSMQGDRGKKKSANLMQEIADLQRCQVLLDLMLQIRPTASTMRLNLVLEAMDCALIDIYDVYSKICGGIARVLLGIYAADKMEADMALKVLQKAKEQGQELEEYFDFCRHYGVFNASSHFLRVGLIPDQDIRDIERIIYGVSEKGNADATQAANTLEEKAMVVREASPSGPVTIMDKWETFDDDFISTGGSYNLSTINAQKLTPVVSWHWETFDEDLNIYGANNVSCKTQTENPVHNFTEIPDLITF